MRRTSITALPAAAGLLVALAGCSDGPDAVQAQPAPAVPPLFVLGDSLSDTGNSAALVDYLLGQPMYPEATNGLCHPGERALFDRDCADIMYGRSRVSNGPVAVEHLAAHAGVPLDPSYHTVPDRPVVGANYAVAGATARGSTPRDLGHQVDRLMLDQGVELPESSTVVLMIGGNDVIDALQATALPSLPRPGEALPDPPGSEMPPPDTGGPAEPGQIVAEAVDAIIGAATRLLDAGACVVLANVPNLARLPAVRETAELEGIDVATALTTAQDVSTGFNASLAEGLATLAATHPRGASVVAFDLFTRFDAAVDAAAAAGSNVTDACFDSELYASSPVGERAFHPDCAPAPGQPPGFDRFFFWDGIHPTGAAHAELGAGLIEAYDAGCGAAEAASGG